MAKIKNGRWVSEDNNPLDPVDMYKLHHQLERIHAFTNGIVELTHDKIEVLSQILFVSPEQEKAILKILKLSTKEVENLPLEELS